jgi:hypothetical protein
MNYSDLFDHHTHSLYTVIFLNISININRLPKMNIKEVDSLKSSIELFKLYRNKKVTNINKKSLVQRAIFKNAIDFAGGNKILQDMYDKNHKKK